MSELNRFLLDNLAYVVGALAGLLLLLLLIIVILAFRVRRATRRYRALVRDSRGGSLEELLHAHIARVDAVARQFDELQHLYRTLAERTEGSLQHVGMVRFNPFEDTGSDQSFAIALLDQRRDGVVISSLHGRNGTRVFAKPVEHGQSHHSLSDEESHAIRIAIGGTGAVAPAR